MVFFKSTRFRCTWIHVCVMLNNSWISTRQTNQKQPRTRKDGESPAQKQQSAMKLEVVRKGQNYKLYLGFLGSAWFNPLSFHVIQFILLGQGFHDVHPLQSSNSKSKMPNPIRDASAVETPLAHLVGSAHDQTAGAARHSYIMLYIVSPHEIRMASFYLVKSQIWILNISIRWIPCEFAILVAEQFPSVLVKIPMFLGSQWP